jgi:hypothetical protein
MKTLKERNDMKPWRNTLGLIGLVLLVVLLAGSCVPWNPFAGAGFGELKIYWVSTNRVYRSELDGTSIEELYVDSGTPTYSAIAFDPVNQKVYWSDTSGTPDIMRSDLDGSGKETISSVGPDTLAIDPYDEKIYYRSGSNNIYRMNLDGSGIETIHTSGGTIRDIALDPVNRRIYWSDGNDIWTSSLTAPLSGQLVRGHGAPVTYIALDVVGGMIYYIDDVAPRRIFKATLSGGSVSLVHNLTDDIFDLDIDPFEGRLYWMANIAAISSIDTVSVDGSNYQQVVGNPGGGSTGLALFLWP